MVPIPETELVCALNINYVSSSVTYLTSRKIGNIKISGLHGYFVKTDCILTRNQEYAKCNSGVVLFFVQKHADSYALILNDR